MNQNSQKIHENDYTPFRVVFLVKSHHKTNMGHCTVSDMTRISLLMYNVCYKALKNHKDALLEDIAVSKGVPSIQYNIRVISQFSWNIAKFFLIYTYKENLNKLHLTEKNFYLSLNLDSMLFAIHIKRFENLQLQRKL